MWEKARVRFYLEVQVFEQIFKSSNEAPMTPNQTKIQEALDPQTVACPKCHAEFVFYRSSAAHIDDYGFESYQLECPQCGTPLSGIIDPADDKLLLSQAS